MPPKKIFSRLLAAVIILTVVALATDAAAHWHNSASDEVHCQVCHIGHASAPGPSAPTTVQSPVPVVRFAAAEEVTVYVTSFRAPSVPRGPPA